MTKLRVYGDLGISDWELLLEIDRHAFIDGIEVINRIFAGTFPGMEILTFLQNADLSAINKPFVSYGPTRPEKSAQIKKIWDLLCTRLDVDPYSGCIGWLILQALGNARLVIIKDQDL